MSDFWERVCTRADEIAAEEFGTDFNTSEIPLMQWQEIWDRAIEACISYSD